MGVRSNRVTLECDRCSASYEVTRYERTTDPLPEHRCADGTLRALQVVTPISG